MLAQSSIVPFKAAISKPKKGKSLDYTIIHQQAHQAEIVESKHIDRALLNQRKAHKPAANHPWRKGLLESR